MFKQKLLFKKDLSSLSISREKKRLDAAVKEPVKKEHNATTLPTTL